MKNTDLPKTVAEMPLCRCGCGKRVGRDPEGNLHIEHFKFPRRKQINEDDRDPAGLEKRKKKTRKKAA